MAKDLTSQQQLMFKTGVDKKRAQAKAKKMMEAAEVEYARSLQAQLRREFYARRGISLDDEV